MRSIVLNGDVPVPVAEPGLGKSLGRVAMILSRHEQDIFGLASWEEGPWALKRIDPLDAGGPLAVEKIKAFSPDIVVTGWRSPFLSEELLRSDLADLKYVCHVTGSVRHVVPRSFIERGGIVSNWGEIACTTVAEHALLLVLACLRRMPQWDAEMDAWRKEVPCRLPTRTLFGKTVGLHGFGAVARCLVTLLRPFGVRITAFSEGVPPAHFSSLGVHRADSLEDLFSGNDIVVECEGLTPATRGVVNAFLLGLLPDGAVLVNVARAALIEEEALYSLAGEGRVQIGLDVFHEEPLSAKSPLRRHPSVIVSPHIAGPTHDRFRLCGEVVFKNLHAFFQNGSIEHLVTLEAYDRST